VEPRVLAAIYVDADLLVLPSVSEASPLVLLEAMACGTPVLTTRIAGATAVVRDWSNGFLINPSREGELAVALRFLWRDPDLCRRMGSEARVLVRERYGWPVVATEYELLYRRVVAPAPGTAGDTAPTVAERPGLPVSA
jgi:glycosyltransferase involved in cell wall biosynthesis